MISAPIVVSGSKGSPSVTPFAASARPETTSSYSARATSTRVPAAQISPWLPRKPIATAGSTLAMSASASTSWGDLPPSSSVIRRKSPAQRIAISRPTSGLPVKLILSTPGWATSAAPATGPRPGITLTVPPGKPASSISAARYSVESGASSAGFTHHRVAGGERRRELPRCDQRRRVPGRDRSHHAERLADRVRDPLLAEERLQVDVATLDLVGPAREVTDDVDGVRDVDHARLEGGLADVVRLERDERLEVALHQVGEPRQQAAALGARHARPLAAVGLRARRAHGGGDVGLTRRGHVRDVLLARRRDDARRSPRRRRRPRSRR